MKELKHLLKVTKADQSFTIIELFCGQDGDGKRFWCYIEILPSKYIEFKEQQNKNEAIQLTKYGKIIASDWGEYPPQDVIDKMESLGVHHDAEEIIKELLRKNNEA